MRNFRKLLLYYYIISYSLLVVTPVVYPRPRCESFENALPKKMANFLRRAQLRYQGSAIVEDIRGKMLEKWDTFVAGRKGRDIELTLEMYRELTESQTLVETLNIDGSNFIVSREQVALGPNQSYVPGVVIFANEYITYPGYRVGGRIWEESEKLTFYITEVSLAPNQFKYGERPTTGLGGKFGEILYGIAEGIKAKLASSKDPIKEVEIIVGPIENADLVDILEKFDFSRYGSTQAEIGNLLAFYSEVRNDAYGLPRKPFFLSLVTDIKETTNLEWTTFRDVFLKRYYSLRIQID